MYVKYNVSPEVMMGHNAALEIADSIYPFARTQIFKTVHSTFEIAEGNFGMNIEDIWQGEVPTRLVVGFSTDLFHQESVHCEIPSIQWGLSFEPISL